LDPAERLDVLVVDESEAFLSSTMNWIASRADLRLVGTAGNGADALAAVERLRPDLVIVEAVLAGVDGFRLARALKKREDAPLVLLVTFHASAAARDQAYAAGADGFLAKYDFSDEIEAILEQWGAARPGRALLRTPATRGRRGSRSVPDP
jgi:DNA-binding NarL/FixJ family response regulator